MIALLVPASAIASASAPAKDLEFFCPVRTQLQQQANFWFEQNPRWRVQFAGYLGSATPVREARRGFFNRIAWRDARERPYEADINWSNSFGSTGVAATVRVKNYAGLVFEGSCYPNRAHA